MPDLSSDIPSYVFCGSLMSEFLRIACCTLCLSDFCSWAGALAMKQQLEKGIAHHPNVFTKYRNTAAEIYECITNKLK